MGLCAVYVIVICKGEFRVRYKLSSNESARKIQKNEPFMRQLVFEILQFKVILLSHKDAAIFLILSLVLV